MECNNLDKLHTFCVLLRSAVKRAVQSENQEVQATAVRTLVSCRSWITPQVLDS